MFSLLFIYFSCSLQSGVENTVEHSQGTHTSKFDLERAISGVYQDFKLDGCKLAEKSNLRTYVDRGHNGVKCEYSPTEVVTLKKQFDAFLKKSTIQV